MSQFLTFNLTVVFVLLLIFISSSLGLSCEKSDRCFCREIEEGVSYSCNTKANLTEQLKIGNTKVEVKCDGTNSSELFHNLPKLNISEVQGAKFEQCLLAEKESLILLSAPVIDIAQIKHLTYHVSDIQNTQIRRENLKGFNNLTLLEIYDKSITFLPDDLFDDLVKLEWLKIITESKFLSSKIFRPLTQLNYLDLSMPLINFESFGLTNNLNEFNLNGDNLETFPNDLFANRENLKTIGFTNSSAFRDAKISENMFKGSVNISHIDLSGNQLKWLADRLFYCQTMLMDLTLRNNSLTELSEDLFIKNDILSYLDLSFNKFVTISRYKRIISSKLPSQIKQ